MAHADYALRGLTTRPLPAPAPAGSTQIRVTVFGDGSGSRFQPRLLPPASSAETAGAYFAPPAVRIDFKGWKTLVFPLDTFTLQAEANPELPAKPISTDGVDRVQFALNGDTGKIFCENLAWTTGDTDTGTIIDDFDAPKNEWKLSGDYFQRQGCQIGVSRLPAFVKSGGSLQISVSHPALAEKAVNTAPAKAELARRKVPYSLYVRPLLVPIYPDSTPSPREMALKPMVRITLCADQTENGTFVVYSGRALKNISLKVTKTLVSTSGKTTLQNENIDLHIVKVWNQAGLDGVAEPGASYSIPEVLVKDDRVPLADVRLTGNPTTDMGANQSKQFWITVRVPKGQPATTYTGALTLSADGVKATVVPLVVDVLPMRLRSPFLQYGVQLDGSVATGDTPLLRVLEDVRDHGFRFVSLANTTDTLSDALTQYEAAGLSAAGPLVVTASLADAKAVGGVEKLREGKNRGALDIYYTNANVKDVQKVNRRGQVVAYIADQAAYDAGGDSFDVAVYALGGDAAQKPLSVGKRQNNKRDWWTWSLGLENPTKNRLFAGYYLYQTGLNGAGLYGAFPTYESIPAGSDIYNETAGTGAQRPQLATYPVKGGVVSTLQWEAARAGVNDIRYITTLKTYLRELKDKIREGNIKDGVAANTAVSEAEAWLVTVMKKPLLSTSPEYLEGIRTGVATRCVKLVSILRKNDVSYPD